MIVGTLEMFEIECKECVILIFQLEIKQKLFSIANLSIIFHYEYVYNTEWFIN